MKRKILNIISTISLAFVMFMMPCLASGLNSTQTKEVVNQTQTRTIHTNQSLDFDNYYSKVNEQCEDVKFEYNEEFNVFNLTATQKIPMSIFEDIDNLSVSEGVENVSVKYSTTYDPETNIVTLYAYINGEQTDALVGCPFTAENGEIDVAFYIDGEIIYLSELQDAGLIQNCGWLSRLFKKVAKVVAVVAVAAVAVVAVAAVAYVAAPVIATVVSTTVAGVSGGAAVLGSTAAVSSAIATGAAAIASTAATVATTAAVVAGTAYVASEIADSIEQLNEKNTSSSNNDDKNAPKGDNKAADGDNVPKYPGDNPSECPGEGYEWRGNGDPSSGEGNWYNPKTGETLHPDLGHEEPYGPHWDYKSPNSGKWYRIFPDGSFGLK